MKIIDKIINHFTTKKNTVKENNKLNVILLYCSNFEKISESINLVFYFDSENINLSDITKFGVYDNNTHIFQTTYLDLCKMRIDNKKSDIINNFFANISNGNNLDKVANINLTKEEIEDVIFDILKPYSGYNSMKRATEDFYEIDTIKDFDHYNYEISSLLGHEIKNLSQYIPIKITLFNIPFYFLEYLILFTKDIHILKKCDAVTNYENIFNNGDIINGINNVIKYADTFPDSMRTCILPLGYPINVEFTTTLDSIFTYLGETENSIFVEFFTNKILSIIVDEKDIHDLSYNRKKDLIQIEEENIEEVDDIISIYEEEYIEGNGEKNE